MYTRTVMTMLPDLKRIVLSLSPFALHGVSTLEYQIESIVASCLKILSPSLGVHDMVLVVWRMHACDLRTRVLQGLHQIFGHEYARRERPRNEDLKLTTFNQR